MSIFRAHLVIALLAFCAGANYLPSKFALAELTPWGLSAWRFIVGAIAIFALLPRESLQLTKHQLLRGGFTGALFAVALVPLYKSLQLTESGITAFLVGSCALIVPVFEYAVLRRVPTRWQVIGLLVAFPALWLISVKSNFSFELGAIYGLISAVIFSMWSVSLSLFGKGIPAKALGLSQIYGATLVSIAIAALLGEFSVPQSSGTWSSLLYLGVVSVALRFMLQTIAQLKTSATSVEIIFLIEPCGALAIGYLFGNEIPAIQQLVGCALIVVGILVAQVRMRVVIPD